VNKFDVGSQQDSYYHMQY